MRKFRLAVLVKIVSVAPVLTDKPPPIDVTFVRISFNILSLSPPQESCIKYSTETNSLPR